MRKLLFLLASLSLGCSSYDLTTPTQDSLAGTWNLTTVNGSPLPYMIPQFGTTKREVLADVLTITAPNTFTEVTTVRSTQNGITTTITVTDSGTYEFTSYTVTLSFQSSGSIGSGTLSGRKMSIITSGVAFTFEKQR